MQPIMFSKMQALGNDFMMIDGVRHPVSFLDQAHTIKALANRRTGLGFDQLLYIEQDPTECADFQVRIFNADGSEVGQCGNGVRCVAKFIFEQGLSVKKDLRITTSTLTMKVTRHSPSWYEVHLPAPLFPSLPKEQGGIFVEVGNPHWVFVSHEDIHQLDIDTLGTQLHQQHWVNLEWVQCLNDEHIQIRIYERGAGETHACGSGAVASVAAMVHHQQLNPEKKIRVDMLGGCVFVNYPDPNGDICLEGEAHGVYHGVLDRAWLRG